MSLPPTTKDISNKPAAGAVTDPVSKQAKDADVDRKLRFYGVIRAFREGRMPSNSQIDETLKYVIEHSPVETEKLSPDGRKLVNDTRDIIETARRIVQDKNADELLQQFFWHTRDVDGAAIRGNVPGKDGVPVDKEKFAGDKEQAVRHLRTLLSLVLTNSEVRKLLSDFSLIGRDLLSTGLEKASGHIRPADEHLSRVDETAPQDEFITEGGRRAGPGETPILEARIPGTDATVKQHPHEDQAKIRGADDRERPVGEVRNILGQEANKMQSGAQGDVHQNTGVDPRDRNQVADIAAGTAQQPSGQVDRSQASALGTSALRSGANNVDSQRLESHARGVIGDEHVDRAKGGVQDVRGSAEERGSREASEREREAAVNGDNVDTDTERKKGGLLGRIRGIRDNLTDRIPDEHQDRIDRGKKFLTEDYFPPERRDQFIYRGKKVIIECQKHDDYQEAMRWLLSWIEEYAGHGRTAVEAHKGVAKDATGDEALQRSIQEIRTLLERFANGKSMDGISDAFAALREDARRDEELRNWFKEVDSYMRKVLLDAGYVLEPDCNNQAKRLRDSGRRFYDDKYKSHFDNLFNAISDWFRAMGDDPLNQRFGEDWARLTKDLLFDSEGSLTFKKDLWNDIRKVILPQLVDKVGYIPIPRIEYTDNSLDLVVENLTLSGRNLFPNIVSLEAHNYILFSPYNTIKDESSHRFTLTFGQIQAEMRDVAFYFKKKSGVPKMSDSGLADVVVGGSGLTATVTLVSAGKDRSSVFKVEDVNVKIDSIKLSIRDSKHDLLYKTLKPLMMNLVKKQTQRAFGDTIRTWMEYLDGQLVSVRDRMESAKGEDGEGRVKVLQELFNRKKDDTSSTTSATAHSTSQFKVVSNKRNSMFANQGHPSGWVNRTAEKAELATHGEDWRSDAFTILHKTPKTASPTKS